MKKILIRSSIITALFIMSFYSLNAADETSLNSGNFNTKIIESTAIHVGDIRKNEKNLLLMDCTITTTHKLSNGAKIVLYITFHDVSFFQCTKLKVLSALL
ncbi:MAG TPA: hypothetical protein VE912_19090 [Bacteroidales bacterium]|nr:hypothetical protein [Bacteroidales bacterium]